MDEQPVKGNQLSISRVSCTVLLEALRLFRYFYLSAKDYRLRPGKSTCEAGCAPVFGPPLPPSFALRALHETRFGPCESVGAASKLRLCWLIALTFKPFILPEDATCPEWEPISYTEAIIPGLEATFYPVRSSGLDEHHPAGNFSGLYRPPCPDSLAASVVVVRYYRSNTRWTQDRILLSVICYLSEKRLLF